MIFLINAILLIAIVWLFIKGFLVTSRKTIPPNRTWADVLLESSKAKLHVMKTEYQEHKILESRSVEAWAHAKTCQVCYPKSNTILTPNEARARGYRSAQTPLEKRIESRRGPQIRLD